MHSASDQPSFISDRNQALTQDNILKSSKNKTLLHNALKEMPLIFREVIVLHEIEVLSYNELADIVGIPVGTVMSRLSRGTRRLQKALSSRMNRRSRSESCSTVRGILYNYISAYIDGELSSTDRAAVEKHFEICPHCANEKFELEQMKVTLHNDFAYSSPYGLEEDIKNRILESAEETKEAAEIKKTSSHGDG